MATEDLGARATPRAAAVGGSDRALAGLVASAGVIHVVATIEHVRDDRWLGTFFAVVGVAQLLAGWWIYRHPGDRWILPPAALGCLLVALLWVLSRTTGLPFGSDAGKVSAVGVADTIATAQELAFAAIAATALSRPDGGGRLLDWLNGGMGRRLTTAILSAGLFLSAIGGHEH